MNKVCPNCFYLGKSKESFFGSLYLGIGLIAAAIINLSFRVGTLDTITVGYCNGLIILGVLSLMNYYAGSKNCPKCGKKEMLSLDDPQAIELIKKYDLKPGENPQPGSLPETNPNQN